MKIKSTLLMALIFLFGSIIVNAQEFNLSDKLPQDKAVLTGELKNGIKYYIRQNSKPEQRVEFRLAINAGSILEDNDQQGLAHFIEHMCFNGSEDFDKNELVSYLEKSGVDFGADLNAYTGFDETVYMFQMPSDRIGLLDTGFIVLENWAHKVSFENEEVDKERGVVKEEWRMGLGAQDRMMKKYIPVLFSGSKYANRLPIGQIEIIDTAHYETIKKFYHDWYRPDLMAVIVVGDIDPAYAEKQIKKRFGKIKGPKHPREREDFKVADNKEPLVSIVTDPEATMNMAMVLFKHEKTNSITIGDYRNNLMRSLYVQMLNARFFEISQNPEAPILYSGSSYGGFIGRSIDTYSLYAMPKENKINDAVSLLIEENQRVKQFGFTDNELKRQKAQFISDLEKSLQEKDKTESKQFVQKYLDNFLDNNAFPGIEYKADLFKTLLPEITIDEINTLAEDLITDKNMIVLITGPEKDDLVFPTEEEILNVITTAKANVLTAYEEEAVGESLITENLVAGKIISTTEDKDFGITTLKLSNGLEVNLKPTTFKNDEILMSSFAKGGNSVASDENFVSAFFTNQIMEMSGVGDFDMITLNKFLTGKNINVNAQIGTLSQGINGNTVNKDLETFLQLVHLKFNSPRKDSIALATFKAQMKTQFKFMESNPQMMFFKKFREMSTSNNPRVIIIPTEEQIDGINLEASYNFYKNSFSNAADFKFFFVGNFDIETIKPLIEKYLGSLPSNEKTSNWVDRKIEFPSGINEAIVNKGTEYKSMVGMMIKNDFDYTIKNRLELQLLVKILSIRLRENMREDQGGVYGVQVQQSSSLYPTPDYNIFVAWGCSPDNVDTLVNTVFTEFDYLIENGPDDINLEKAIETYNRDLESSQEENNYWLNKIKDSNWLNTDLLSAEELRALAADITKEDLQAAAIKYFTKDHYLKVVLMPEETTENK
jgi:zinc protease